MSLQTLDPSKTALVVIDMQKMVTARDCKPYSSDDVLSKCVELTRAFRSSGGLVVLVHVLFSADGKDRLKPMTAEPQPAGSLPPDYAEIDPSLKPDADGTLIVAKKQWGAFYGTDLELQLRRRGVDTIVICGIATNFGVESTARDGWERGFQFIFAEDATTTFTEEAHAFAYKAIFPRLGLIASTQEIVSAFA